MFAVRIGVTLVLMGWAGHLVWQSASGKPFDDVLAIGSAYPVFVLSSTLALLAAHLIVNLLPAARTSSPTLAELLPESRGNRARLFLFAALWVGYVAVLPVLGYLVATTASVAGSALLLDPRRRWWVALLGALAFTLAVQVLFRTVFYVLLPTSFVDEWLEALLYKL